MTVRSNCYKFAGMEMTEIRKSNLRMLVGRYETQYAFAAAANMNVQYLNQLLTGKRNLGEKTARKIEKSMNLDAGWLDRAMDAQHNELSVNNGSLGLSHRAIKVGKMFDRLSPEQQDAMQRIVDALAQQVGNDIADHG